ncbi:ATRIP protein, partial [Amia calva]|nr:ATRIP protein [Amia calva]
MEYPPRKRLKGPERSVTSNADPFGDDEDFTQDDLDEIDVIASQAITEDIVVKVPKVNLGSIISSTGAKSKAASGTRDSFALASSHHVSGDAGYSNLTGSDKHATEQPCGNGDQSRKDRETLFYESFESQHAELKKKLKGVEEQLLIRNGEIRVLRDSLRHLEQEREQQRKAQLLVEQERAQIQGNREKELNKKIQSLQSELHFKEAEMNEMKINLQTCERGNRLSAFSVTKNSPRRSSSGVVPQEGPSSPAVRRSSFLSKETFATDLPRTASPVKVHKVNQCLSSQEDTKALGSPLNSSIKNDYQSTSYRSQCRGSILLNLLLQHPLDPSPLGLCHLLCITPEALPSSLSQHKYFKSASTASSGVSTENKTTYRQHNGFNQVQSLAISGINMLALDHLSNEPSSNIVQSHASNRCSAAVHLLPLLEYHIGMFCQALESAETAGKSPLRGSSLSVSSSEGSLSTTAEESLGSLEEFALAALKALYHLISQSLEVVHALLSNRMQESTKDCAPKVEVEEFKLNSLSLAEGKPGSSEARETSDQLRHTVEVPHPLFKRLMQLADPTFAGAALQKETVLASSLTTLNMLAERAPDARLVSFKCFLGSQPMVRCLSADSSYRTVCLSVSLLGLTANHRDVAAQLCSHSEVCPLQKLYMYITSRPDKSVTDNDWTLLEVEVVRFLTKLCTQSPSLCTSLVEPSCPCNNEVVRTLVLVLHRQWLEVRVRECREGRGGPLWASPAVVLLREALLLLHWLSQNDAGFTEHCLDVLHMYEQVIPAIRDTFRKIPNLMESEELALEEICRPEADTDDMDIDYE